MLVVNILTIDGQNKYNYKLLIPYGLNYDLSVRKFRKKREIIK